MDNEKFTFTIRDLTPEARAEFEDWLGFKVNDWEILTTVYRAEEEPLNEALDIFFDSFEEDGSGD